MLRPPTANPDGQTPVLVDIRAIRTPEKNHVFFQSAKASSQESDPIVKQRSRAAEIHENVICVRVFVENSYCTSESPLPMETRRKPAAGAAVTCASLRVSHLSVDSLMHWEEPSHGRQ